MNNDEFLRIRIENTKPIELIDFTNSFLAIHSQYKRFVSTNYKNIDDEVKLYVEELKDGSKIVKLVRKIGDRLFIEPIVDKFNQHLEKKFNAFLEQKIPELEGVLGYKVNKQELKEVSTILKHNSDDYKSTIHFESGSSNNTTHNHYYTGIQARAISDEANKNLKLLENGDSATFHEEVLELIVTDNNVIKGRIENIDDKPIKILNNEFKDEMLKDNEKNPFNMYYIVNGDIKRVGDKIVAYSIKEIVDRGTIRDKDD